MHYNFEILLFQEFAKLEGTILYKNNTTGLKEKGDKQTQCDLNNILWN